MIFVRYLYRGVFPRCSGFPGNPIPNIVRMTEGVLCTDIGNWLGQCCAGAKT